MKRIALAITLLVGVVGVLVAPDAKADETWCGDGHVFPGGMATPIIGYPGAPLGSGPITLGAQTTVTPTHVWIEVCYGTGPAGSSGQLAAGNFFFEAIPTPSGVTGRVGCDGGSAIVSPDCTVDYAAVTTPTVTPTAGLGGLYLTAVVPFTLCAGVCVTDSVPVGTTGVIVGTLAPISHPGIGAGYRLSSAELWLNGTQVHSVSNVDAGAFVTPPVPGLTTPTITGSTPPCVIGGICLPWGQLGIAGATGDVTLFLPTGTTTVPVTIPSRCLVNFSGPC